MINSRLPVGFVYRFKHFRDGVLIDEFSVKNLMPFQGIDHMLDVLANSGAQVAAWHIGLYGNNYAPQASDTMATFPGLAGELTGYAGDRAAFISGPAAGGVLSNAGQEAEFTITASQTVRGGFIASHATKGSTAGLLLSAVQLPSPRTFEAGDVVTVAAGLEISPT